MATQEQTGYPQPSFEALVNFFLEQAFLGLGAVKRPDSDEPLINLPFARFVIDLLEVVEEKTEGNLTAPERNYLRNKLYDLRMAYVRVAEAQKAAQEKRATAEAKSQQSAESPGPSPEDDLKAASDSKEG
ncbi:MAG: hypothetical protein KatS3mg115_0116 [Candidatus Poribacteria bacterium]|nr:MAG: hypothetical protein KatS3mg115_0116 [Candidatus Poribacteria bacterium]